MGYIKSILGILFLVIACVNAGAVVQGTASIDSMLEISIDRQARARLEQHNRHSKSRWLFGIYKHQRKVRSVRQQS